MSYPQPLKKTGVSREVLKWLQSLDLSLSAKNIRRDFSNGYLVAEIFSWYYPEDFPMHSYGNGTSLPTKQSNWSQIERFLLKQNIMLPKDVIDGTIHCKPGAAELLIQDIYTLLTNRHVRSPGANDVDFTDRSYQDNLPMVARSTASKAIKNNLRLSEVLAEPSIDANKQKIQAIIHMHLQRRQEERLQDPKRFDKKPTLGEQAVRLPPPPHGWKAPFGKKRPPKVSPAPSANNTIVQFKEISVRQTDKPSVLSNINMPAQIQGF